VWGGQGLVNLGEVGGLRPVQSTHRNWATVLPSNEEIAPDAGCRRIPIHDVGVRLIIVEGVEVRVSIVDGDHHWIEERQCNWDA
jgi:hypothetical protein